MIIIIKKRVVEVAVAVTMYVFDAISDEIELLVI